MSRALVVEADGGSRGNPGPAAYGSVVKDAETGDVLVERAEAIGVATNNVAEYRGVIAGLEEAHRIDESARIEVRLDSKLVVEQMSGRWKIKHADMRELAMRARDVHDMSMVRWTWVPRAQNAHADRLLNEVLDGKAPIQEIRPVMRPRALGDPTTLFLLRHGETPLTVARRFSGRGGVDVGLTDAGQRQAERAASVLVERLGTARLAAVVASPLLRTRQTAQAVADRLGLPVETDDDLEEVGFGEWDGLGFHQARERDPAFFDAWLVDPTLAPPGGESLAALAERVERSRRRVVERFDSENVLLVAHAMVVKTIVAAAVGGPVEAAHRVDVQPASLAEVAYWSDGRPSLRSLGLR
jgi:ribonuclease H / adenosylcobalamin/alpha-ribazole phosphatase